MKTRKHNLNAIALGVALAMGSMSALAAFDNPPPVANPAAAYARGIVGAELGLPYPAIPAREAFRTTKPSFNSNEQVGLCLIESVASLLATRTNDFGCNAATYDLQVFTDSPTHALAELDGGVGVGGTTLDGQLGPKEDIGTLCRVNDADGLNLLKGLEVVDYTGTHGWSRTNEIFNSIAELQLRDPQTGGINFYAEVDIKDFFKRVIDGRSWEFDWGLEDIKKFRGGDTDFYLPVQKWGELSWYRHENGQEGGLWVKKILVIPRSAVGCKVTVEAYDVNNGSGEFEVGATVKVGN